MSMIKWKPLFQLDESPDRSFTVDNLSVDVYEDKHNVVATMHVPGINADDIEIDIEAGHAYVYGEREENKELSEKDYSHKEIRYGKFERVIPLPCCVDEEKTTAELHNGVLTITMPKIAGKEKEGKRIAIVRK